MASSFNRSVYTNPSARTWTIAPPPSNTAAIKAFYATLPNFAPTPLIPLPSLATELGLKAIYLKAETSRLGLPSFKLLGVSWAIRQSIIQRAALCPSTTLNELQLAVKELGIKLCAATDGNHGRAVARMGSLLGVSEVRIFVPRGLDETIIQSISSEGAVVEVVSGDYDESVRVAHCWGEETEGGMLIEGTAFEGYEDVPKWTVEGYSTMLHEIDAQLGGEEIPSLIACPVGVGSLAQSIVTHYKCPRSSSSQLNPAVLTVEPHTAASLHLSLLAGTSLSIATSPTIMTGLECGTISTAAWPVLKEGVDASLTVGDVEVHRAVRELEGFGVMAGPCGAASLAGLKELVKCEELKGGLGLGEESVVVLICTEGTRAYAVPQL